MALKSQLRSTALSLWYASERASSSTSNGSVAVVDSATSGVFGGKLIDFATHGKANLDFAGGRNWATGVTGVFTLLMRIVPTWTGSPSDNQLMLCLGDPSGLGVGGLTLAFTASGAVVIKGKNDDSNSWYSDQLYGSPQAFPDFQNGVPIDVWIQWDGENNSQIKFWTALNGATAVQLSSGNGNSYVAGTMRSELAAMIQGMRIGYGKGIDYRTDYYINEMCVWDTMEDPASYGARTDFIPAANFNHARNVDPGVDNVAVGVDYTINGDDLTGEYVPGGDCPVSTDPGVANVRAGVEYTLNDASRVGTAAIPSAANVRAGVNVDATVGSLVAPSLANTKVGVAGDGGTGTYDGSDRWSDPGVGNVRAPTAYKANSTSNNRTGTVSVPALADTKVGVAGDGGLGTYDGSDRWSDPGQGNVSTGIHYKANSTSNNRTGTRDSVTNEVGDAVAQGDDLEATASFNEDVQ